MFPEPASSAQPRESLDPGMNACASPGPTTGSSVTGCRWLLGALLVVAGCAPLHQTPPELCQDSCGLKLQRSGTFTAGTPDRCTCADTSWCGNLCKDHGFEVAASFRSGGQDTCRCYDGAFFIGGQP